MKAHILLPAIGGLLFFSFAPAKGDTPTVPAPAAAVVSAPALAAPSGSVFSDAVPAEMRAPTRPPRKQSAQGPSYTVRNGDNISVIAKVCGVSPAALLEANQLSSSSLLRIGQTLKIPGGKVVSSHPGESAPAKPKTQPRLPEVKTQLPAAVPPAATAAVSSQPEGSVPPTAAGVGEAGLKAPETAPLFKQENSSEKTGGPNLMGGAGGLLSLVLKLGFVLLLAYAGARAMRRFALRSANPAAANASPASPRATTNMEILETIALGPERWIHVVSLGSKAYLLSSTPQQTALLTEVTDTGLLQELREKQLQENGFAGQLAQFMAQDRGKLRPAQPAYPASFFAAKIAGLNPFGGRRQ
jgi:LysM repeat protein/flagellar biogenesis protein FliO